MNILTIMHSKAFLLSFSHVKKTKKNRAIMTLPTYRQSLRRSYFSDLCQIFSLSSGNSFLSLKDKYIKQSQRAIASHLRKQMLSLSFSTFFFFSSLSFSSYPPGHGNTYSPLPFIFLLLRSRITWKKHMLREKNEC